MLVLAKVARARAMVKKPERVAALTNGEPNPERGSEERLTSHFSIQITRAGLAQWNGDVVTASHSFD